MSKVDDILEQTQAQLAGTDDQDLRVRLRNAQIQAMALRYNPRDLTPCREAIRELTQGIAEDRYKPSTLIDAIDGLELAYCVAGFWDLDMYFYALEFRRKPMAKYYEPRREVLKGVADAVTDMMIHDKYDLLVLNMPPRTGKLIADNTPVLTARGWITHGELRVGDRIAAPDGRFVRVEHVFPKDMADYEVSFSNGETVKCHGNHEWVVYDRHAQKDKIVETNYMRECGVRDNYSDGTHNHYRFLLNSKVRRISITGISPCEPEQGNCIQVEGGVYCVGDTLLPTHNSTLGIMSCGWVGGREPTKQTLLSGYASPLTDSFYKELNDITQNEEYNFLKVFRNIKRIGQSAESTSIDYDYKKSTREELARFPTWACRAIGGSLNGQVEAGSLLYCDDLTRGYEEALSLDQMNKLYGRYLADLGGRKKDGCKEFHIGTRWSIHDPLGRIIENNKDNPRFKMIAIPALDPATDESNFYYSGHKDGFSTDYYKNVRATMLADKDNHGDVTWLSLYQQEPRERGSMPFNAEELLRIDDPSVLEKMVPSETIAFVDVAFGGKDYLSMPIAKVFTHRADNGDVTNDVYIVDWLFIKGDYKVTEPLVHAKIRQWKISRIAFEANNGGDFYSRDIEALLEKDGVDRAVWVTSKTTPGTSTKLNRIEAHTPAILSFVFLSEMWYNDMYRDAVKNLTTFSRDGNNVNDDAPDSLAGLAGMLRTRSVSEVQILDRGRYL